MIDKNNEMEHSGIKIQFNHIKDVQNLMKKYDSIRFLHNPMFWKHGSYFEIAVGGKAVEVNEFTKEIYEANWDWEKPQPEKKIPWWKKLFGGRR